MSGLRAALISCLILASGPRLAFSQDVVPAIAPELVPPGADQSAVDEAEDPASYGGLSVSISYLLKTKADERFLSIGKPTTEADVAEITQLYAAAAIELACPAAVEEVSRAIASASKLLCADIAYRSLLARQKLSFWGGVSTMTPEIPPVHLRNLRRLLSEFETLAIEVDAGLGRSEDLTADALRTLAESQRTLGEANASREAETGALISRKQADVRGAQLQSKLDGLEQERAELFQAEAGAVSSLDAASAALNQILTQGVLQAAGAPPWVSQAAAAGSPEAALKGALFAAVGDQLADPNSSLAKELDGALDKLGTSSLELVDLYRDAENLKRTVERYGNDAEQIAAFLRQPTLDSFFEVGTVVWRELPADKKLEWRQRIIKAKPVLEIAALMGQPDALSERLKGGAIEWLSSQPRFTDFLTRSVRAFLQTKTADASRLYVDLLTRLTRFELKTDRGRVLLDSGLRAAAASILNSLPDEVRAELRRSAGVQTDLELEAKVAERGLAAVPAFVISGDRLTVVVANRTLFDKRLLDLLELSDTDVPTEVATRELERLLVLVGQREDELRNAAVELLPVEQVAAGLSSALKGAGEGSAKINKAWEKIVVETGAAVDTGERLAITEAGAAYSSDRLAKAQLAGETQTKANPLPANLGARPSPASAPPGLDPVMTTALNAAFPGAGTAAQVAVGIMAGLAEVDAAMRRLDRIQERIGRNFLEAAHASDLKQEAQNAAALALLEAAYYKALDEAYREAAATLRAGVEQLSKANSRALERLQRRGPLTFYLSERLREEFDRLDRSVALWAGFRASPRGAIAQLIREDPQNVRLALDSQIHLYGFLDRSGEGMRTDPDRLLIHWRQLVRLAEDACAKVGCETLTGAAQVRDSGPLSICDLLSPEDRRRLREWQLQPEDKLTLSFFTDAKHLGLLPEHRNHRLIDVRLAGMRGGGPMCFKDKKKEEIERYQPLSSALVTHPGVAFVPTGDGLAEKETLLLRRGGTFASPTPFDVEALNLRWSSSGVPQRRFFEGYGLITEWQLELNADPRGGEINDIIVRFAYQYNDPLNIVTEREFAENAVSAGIDPSVFEFTWDAPSPRGRDSDGNSVVFRAVPGGSLPADPFALMMVSGVAEAVRSARFAAQGIEQSTLYQPSDSLKKESFRLVRKCKTFAELVDLVTERRRSELGGSDGEIAFEYRRRQVERLLGRQHAAVKNEVDTILTSPFCTQPHVLIGPPLPQPATNAQGVEQ